MIDDKVKLILFWSQKTENVFMKKTTMQSDFYFINVAWKVSQNYYKHSETTIRQNFFPFSLCWSLETINYIKYYLSYQEEPTLI